MVLLLALGAMLIAFVFRKFIGDFLAGVFEGIPILGKTIADALRWAVEQADKGARVVVDAAVQPLTDFVDGLVGSGMAAVAWLTAAATWLGVTLKGILAYLQTQVTAVIRTADLAISTGLTALQRIAALAASLASTAARVAWVVATAIPAAIASAVAKAVAQATALVNAAKSLLLAGINAALATALRAVGSEQAARAAADTAVRAYAAATAALVGQQAALGLQGLGQAIDAAEVQLGQAIDGIAAKIGPIAFPTVAIAIETITATITTLERTCVNPTCNYLGPQLDALNLAMDAAMLAAVMELVAQAATDPEGAARGTVETASPILGMVSGLFADFTGIGVRA